MKKLLLLLVVNVLALSIAAQTGTYSYWFDADCVPAETGALAAGGASLQADASDLGAGVHQIYFQIRGGDGTLSNVCSAPFLNPVNLEGARAYIYVDGEPFGHVAAGEGNTAFELDGSALDHWLHTLSAIVVCRDGSASGMKESVFMRVPNATDIREMRCYYTLDNDSTTHVEGHFSGNMLVADIDASQLADGLHSISFLLASPDGLVTRLNNAWFMKLPLGGVNIRSYEYWVNDDVAGRYKVELTDAPNPFTLTALLPLAEYPLRSSSFHFSVDNGVPKIAPQHDFNVLFTDNRGYFTLQSTPYFDPAHAAPVTDIAVWEAGRHRVEAIGENEIRWYSVDAEAGDSLGLSSDIACMFELYAPDGTKLMDASGAKAVKGAGTHTLQTGTHYIAVHDPTQVGGSPQITLSRIDRFALLKYTPGHFAARNFVIFDLTGNGFESLKGVSLAGAETRTCDRFVVYDWSYARAAFFFMENSLANGPYDLTLTFADEDGGDYVITRRVNVEDATEGELQVSVNTRSNTITDPRTISVTITNPTNVGLWDVPFCVARTSVEPPMYLKFPLIGCKEGDPVYYDTDNLLGTGVAGRYLPIIIPYVGPNQQLVYDFVIDRVIGNDFDFYAWCGIPWSVECEQKATNAPAKVVEWEKHPTSNFNYEAYHSFHEAMGIASHLKGPAGHAAGCVDQALNISNSWLNYWADKDYERKQLYDELYPGLLDEGDLPNYPNANGFTPMAKGTQDGGDGTGTGAGDGAGINGHNAANAENPNPMPPSHPVNFPASVAPNDIIGYSSPSGTGYIGKTVRTLGYTVEFENDPEFATASALTVVIDNKLDGGVFDLTSFRPVSLRLGKKEVSFDGNSRNLVTTVDMRPEINGIAQATVAYDAETGDIKLTIESLSPYTMELTDDVMQGFLPVNINGEGIGEFCYSIDLRETLADGTGVDNKATITFDSNEPIETPIWHNVLDYTLPESRVTGVATDDNVIYRISVDGSDTGAGVWRYSLYMHPEGSLAWQLIKPNVEGDEIAYTASEELVNPTFMTVATDRAGNVERNEISAGIPGDIDLSGRVDANDIVLLTGFYVGRSVNIALSLADLNTDGDIDAQDMVGIRRIYVNSALHTRSRLIRTKK